MKKYRTRTIGNTGVKIYFLGGLYAGDIYN